MNDAHGDSSNECRIIKSETQETCSKYTEIAFVPAGVKEPEKKGSATDMDIRKSSRDAYSCHTRGEPWKGELRFGNPIFPFHCFG